MVIRTLFSACLLFTLSLCYAQQNYIDSLENLVKTTPNDTTKVWLLNRLVTSLREGDNNKALTYAHQAKELAEVLNYERGLAWALENLGWLSYRRGDDSKAFQLATEALKLSQKFHDYPAIARCLNSIASTYYEQKQYDIALSNFKGALDAAKRGSDKTAIARSMNNVAFTMMYLDKYDSAAIHAEQAVRLSQQAQSTYLEGYAYRTLGDVDLHYKRVEASLAKFRATLQFAEKSHNMFLKTSTMHRVGKAYILLNKPDQALKLLLENIELAKKYGYRDEVEYALKLTSEAYAAKNLPAKAYEYQSRYLQLHDSLYDQRNSEHLAVMQARFEAPLKEAEIELLKKDTQIKQQEINSQKVWMYFTIGLLSLAAILVFVLLYSNWIKRKANDLLETKNQEIQAQALQLSNLNSTKDKLLSIISHDVRGPLASLRGLVNIICTGGLTQQEFLLHSLKVRHNLDAVQEDLDNLLYWAQSQLQGIQINCEELKVRTIVEEKIKLFKDAADRKELTIINEITEELAVLADKNHLGLILRNLMANAIKFNMRGGSIRIQEKRVGDHVEISVTDSGVGIKSSDLKRLFNAQTHFSNLGTHDERGAGIGLLLTKEFIEKNGGIIWVTSEVGKGSTFTFTTKRAIFSKKFETELVPTL
ncbi:MAG TPA: tetratricopeptide repeat-containing sensor histidine kinase [Chryseolinea sp.]|nr:tetratricopeptide repeat-containing sensor histidine kinase [Chryseolinea sp.]